METLGILEPVQQALGGNGADVGDGGKGLGVGRHEGVQGAKMGREHLSSLLPHLPDAEGKEEPPQTGRFGLLNGGDQVFGALFAHALQLLHILHLQVVEVARALHQPRSHQSLHYSGAEVLDIHGIPAGEVHQMAQPLGGTLRTGAANVGAVLVPCHRRSADRACGGQEIRFGPLRAFLLEHRDDLRDDLPRLLDQHCVANADILFGDKILVVQGGVGDGGACKANRLYNCLGRKHPGPANLDHNVLHHALLLLRRILEGGGPAGKFRGGTQLLSV